MMHAHGALSKKERHDKALQLAENVGLDAVLAAVATVVLTNAKEIDCMVMTMSPGLDKDPVDHPAVVALCAKMVRKAPALGARLGTTGTSTDVLKLRAWLGQLVKLRDGCNLVGVAAVMPAAAGAPAPGKADGDTEAEKDMGQASKVYARLSVYGPQMKVPLHEQLDYALVAKLERAFNRTGAFSFEIELDKAGRQINKKSKKTNLGNGLVHETEEVEKPAEVRAWQMSQVVRDIFLVIAGILAVEIRHDAEPLGGGEWIAASTIEAGKTARYKGTRDACTWMATATVEAMGRAGQQCAQKQFNKVWSRYNTDLQSGELHHDMVVRELRKNPDVFNLTEAEKEAARAGAKRRKEKEQSDPNAGWQQGRGAGA